MTKRRIGLIKKAEFLQTLNRKSFSTKPLLDSLEKVLAIFRPIRAVLLVFDNVVTRQPRPRRHAAVDDNERILLQRLRRRLDASDQRIKIRFFVFHRPTSHPKISLRRPSFAFSSAAISAAIA